MVEELTYDLLVHPFYTLAFYPFADKEKEKTLLSNAMHLSKRWFSRISALRNDSKRGLIIIKPEFGLALKSVVRRKRLPSIREAVRLFDSLERFAERSLGKRRVIVRQTQDVTSDALEKLLPGLRRRLLTPRGRDGASMGEYYQDCVKTASESVFLLTGQKPLRSKSRSLSGYNPKLVQEHFDAVLGRAKRIAGLRARKSRRR